MAKWQKSSPELIAAFDHIMARFEGTDRRQMFGYPTGYVNDIWFVGCYEGNQMVLRLADQDRQEFLKLDGAKQFEPMPGRPMREFVVVPWWLIEDAAQMDSWLERSITYSSSLPKPEKKARSKKKSAG